MRLSHTPFWEGEAPPSRDQRLNTARAVVDRGSAGATPTHLSRMFSPCLGVQAGKPAPQSVTSARSSRPLSRLLREQFKRKRNEACLDEAIASAAWVLSSSSPPPRGSAHRWSVVHRHRK